MYQVVRDKVSRVRESSQGFLGKYKPLISEGLQEVHDSSSYLELGHRTTRECARGNYIAGVTLAPQMLTMEKIDMAPCARGHANW